MVRNIVDEELYERSGEAPYFTEPGAFFPLSPNHNKPSMIS